MPFDADELRRATFVRHVEIHETLGSTNDRAAELARELPDVALPALVLAKLQTAGRGRGQKQWWSAEGALTFSLLLDTSRWGIAQRDWPQLSLQVANAVGSALLAEVPAARVSVKPPNDVLINGRKVCGILIESPGGAAPAKDRLIIGIGVNVNNSWKDAPRQAGEQGVSLFDFSGRLHDMPGILTAVTTEIERRISNNAGAAP